MSHRGNEGVIQTGGSMNVGNMAVGRNASIHNTQSSDSGALREMQQQLANLLQVLEQHQREIPNHADVVQSVQTVKQEIAKDQPNRLTIKSLLRGIADSVKSVATVATAVEALKVAAVALFG